MPSLDGEPSVPASVRAPGGHPRGPEDLRFRVTDLRRHPGSREEAVRTARLGGLRVGDAEVDDEPVVVAVALESLSDGVRVEGTVEYAWTASCRRCLGEAAGSAVAPLEELFADDPSAFAGEEDVQPIHDGWVDIGDVVRDTVLLGLPLAPLCGPDCAGPAPSDFPVTVEPGPIGPGSSDPDPVGSGAAGGDPRWAALSELRFDPEDG